MIDPTPEEIQAMMQASDAAGQFLESLGKTDMMQMTPDEWMQLVECICTGYQDAMIAASTSAEP